MKKLTLYLTIITMILSTFSCGKSSLDSDQDKYSYAIGIQVTRNIKSQRINLDPEAFALAVKDVMQEKKPRLDEMEMRSAIMKMNQDMANNMSPTDVANKQRGDEYLLENKKKPGVTVTESGLQYRVLRRGSGKNPKINDSVKVHYRGTLIDGKEFDSSHSRGKPAVFPVNRVIPGWTEALQLMNSGAKYELVIPSDIAYGSRGTGSIPPHSVLIFEVELLGIE